MVSSSSADLARLLRDLDEAKKKIKQWEDAWHQVKQVRDDLLILHAASIEQLLVWTLDYIYSDQKIFKPRSNENVCDPI